MSRCCCWPSGFRLPQQVAHPGTQEQILFPPAASRAASIVDLRLDQHGEMIERLLPTKVAGF
jgi:hypothetical protein